MYRLSVKVHQTVINHIGSGTSIMTLNNILIVQCMNMLHAYNIIKSLVNKDGV